MAAPCYHSRDKPVPRSRGRDQLRRRRQRPSQVRSKTSRARPCEASGALLLSNGGTGGGHAACTLWPPPAAFGYFPMMESTSPTRRRAKPPTRNGYLVEGRKRAYLSFPYPKGFRLCGGDQRAFRSPFGNLRPLATSRNLCKKQLPCRGQENAFLSFPVSQTLSPLRRRPGSFPLAPLSPFRWRKIFLPPHVASATKNPRPPRPKAAEARGSILPKDSSFSR